MKNTTIIIVLIIIVALFGFAYATRPTSAPTQSTESVVETSTSTAVVGTTYKINPSQSLVEFRIGEILNNKPFTAVGTTSDIAGDITVSGDSVTLGKIAINAKTFKTDSEKRDGAIVRFIIKAEDPANEFIVFEPKSMDAKAVTGDLTFAGVKKAVTFDVLTFTAGTSTLTGTATTKLKRADFNLVIPSLSFIASVDDEFIVNVNVVADLVQ